MPEETESPWFIDHWISAVITRFPGIDARRMKSSDADLRNEDVADLPPAVEHIGKTCWAADLRVMGYSDGENWLHILTDEVLS
jgi:hypothetical protein